jgi:hypothetical protein
MELPQGTRLGPYEILGPLGAGGMGRVFRARDVKLDRPVAIKVLRADWAHDPEWLARFEREARLLATLNHPNIATVHGLGEADGSCYLAMELVPGQTLAQRLARGPLPADEALSVCVQVAAALDAAHDRGIIHRDLKPANVMLTPDGKVKVLDFGLARGTEAPAGMDDTSVPYEAQTDAGAVAGTAAYMAPEQARGGRLDRRCDLWAFGCVLYESLTGRPVFPGATAADIQAAVLERPPAWEALPARLPPGVGRLLRRCLQKDPNRRLRDAGDARLELEEALAEPTQGPATPPPERSPRWWRLAWAMVTAAVALAAFALGSLVFPKRGPVIPAGPAGASAWSGQFLLGGATRAYQPRVSPDGNWLAFIVHHEGQGQVGVMKLNSGEWWVLTRNRERGAVSSLCWSNDSTRVFFDRVADMPVGVYSASPLDRAPEGAREVLLLKEVDCPEAIADGSLVVSKLEAGGNYRLRRRFADGSVRPVGPPLEFNRAWTAPVRALHAQNKLVFCGKVRDGKAPPEQLFYLLDLDTDEYRPLSDKGAGGAIVPLAVSPQDDFAYSVLPADDVFQLVRIPLAGGGRPEPLLTLTAFPWGLDVGADGRVYTDQVRRSLDVMKFGLPGPAGSGPSPVERLAASVLWREKTEPVGLPVELPDGRVLVPSKVAGRSQLLACLPRRAPTPLLEGSKEETALPAVLVGRHRLAFMTGSGKERRLRLASLEDGVRLEPVAVGVVGWGLSALAASPDGRTLYYVQSRQVHEVPADGTRPPRTLAPGDGVAVHPTTGALLIQRFERAGVHLFQRPRRCAPFTEVNVQPGPWRLAPIPISGRVIDAKGRVLVVAASRASWFWRPALLDSTGKLQPIPAAYDGDLYPAEWSKDNRILGMGYALYSDLWQIRLPHEP